MQAGALRRKLIIQQATRSQDAYGFGGASTWTDVLTAWGSVKAKQGTALMQVLAGQQMPSSAYLITLRYPPSIAIKAGMRVLDGSNTYTIQNVVDVDERHRELQLYCTQAPAPGA